MSVPAGVDRHFWRRVRKASVLEGSDRRAEATDVYLVMMGFAELEGWIWPGRGISGSAPAILVFGGSGGVVRLFVVAWHLVCNIGGLLGR